MSFRESRLSTMLTDDHRCLLRMLHRLPSTPGAERRAATDEVIGELVRHVVAEDMYVFPAVRACVPERVVDVAEQIDAHAKIEHLLAELATIRPVSLMFDAVVTKLMCELDRVAIHEEVDVFPWLDLHADPRRLAELAEDVQRFKDVAVVETPPDARVVIRIGDQVLDRWEPPPS